MKKTLAGCISLVALATLGFAEEAAPANPKATIEFSQQIDGEFVNGNVATASGSLFGTDAVYEKTEIKGTATYALGDDLSVSPSLKDGLEAKLDPNGTWLGKTRFRNRFNPAVNVQKKFIPEFALNVSGDYRLASDLNSANLVASTTAVEHRLGGTIGGSGKVVSLVDYGVTQSFNYYLDSSDNGADDSFFELSGTYGAGTAFKLDGPLTLKLNLSDSLTVDFLSPNDAKVSTNTAQIYNYGTLKATLASAEFSPFVGLLLTNVVNKIGAKTVNFVGGTFGADFTKGSYVISGKYDVGVNAGRESAKGVSAGADQTESHLSVLFKVKI